VFARRIVWLLLDGARYGNHSGAWDVPVRSASRRAQFSWSAQAPAEQCGAHHPAAAGPGRGAWFARRAAPCQRQRPPLRARRRARRHRARGGYRAAAARGTEEPVEMSESADRSMVQALIKMGHEMKIVPGVGGSAHVAEVLKEKKMVRAGGGGWAAGVGSK